MRTCGGKLKRQNYGGMFRLFIEWLYRSFATSTSEVKSRGANE